MKSKIERGDFIELDRLLPKHPSGAGGSYNQYDENKVELVSRGGHTYFKPIKETQINGLRKWEQAFRVYAAIYTQANPEKAGEIWQYMHLINVAASAYQWSNVASYDVTFRQLMAFKPNHSLAKTYHQGWNLVMKEPLGLNKSGGIVAGTSNSNNNFQSGSQSRQNTSRGNWHDDCCWKFNRNNCKRAECHFDHCCTYCGGWNHGYYNCRKHLRKERGGGGGNSSSRRNHSPKKRT